MIKKIAHSEVHFYNSLIQDYLEKKDSVKPLINYFPDAIHEFLTKKSFSTEKRNALVNAIAKQYEKAKIDLPKTLSLLKNENCFTVTTGHQLNIFGGPLFFIYKITEAIKLADELSKANKNHTILPVFWLASEDHDFQEINSVSIATQKFEWKTNQKGAVGRFTIDEPFIEEFQKLLHTLAGKPFTNKLKEIFESSYKIGETLSDCTRRLAHSLFKNTNLIIVDGDDEDLKKIAKHIFEQELTQETSFKEVSKTNQYLKKNNYHEQVFVREINLFHLSENDRKRIEKNTFKNEDELLKDVKNISPNALFRPLYQETILPNLAYIGGAGEISYWLQLKSTFEAFNVDFPILCVRNSILNLDKSTSGKLHKLKLSEADIFKTTEDLKKEFVLKNSSHEIDFSSELLSMKSFYANLSKKVESLDLTLVSKVNAMMTQAENSIVDLEKKVIKAQKQKFETSLLQIEKLKEKLFPNGLFQERSESFAFYYSIYGDDFLKETYNTITPFDNSIKVRIDE
ncbi:MAG: bacillithiol biosynthesis cysteine-adding enzyme BshC [Bacteroidia bacterium]